MDLDLSELSTFADELLALDGVRSVVRDPAKLVTPGVWLQVLAFEADTLSADVWRVDVNLRLVVPNTDPVRAIGLLVDLVNTLRPALGYPSGPFTARTYVPDRGDPLPALDVPMTLRITPNQEN